MAAGTLSVTNNSKAVVGVGTTFTAFKAGDFLTLVVGQVPYTVAIASVESATALTLVLPFDGPTATGLAWDGVKRDTMSLATMGVTVQAQKALRLMIADENNWRAIFGDAEEITVTLPNGQVMQGMSWGYLSQLMKQIDPVEMRDLQQQAETAKNQAVTAKGQAESARDAANTAKTGAENARNQANTARDKANTAKTGAESARDAANTAKTGAKNACNQAQGYRDEAEQFKNQINPSQFTLKSQNLNDVADKDTARDNLSLGRTQRAQFAGVDLSKSDWPGLKFITTSMSPTEIGYHVVFEHDSSDNRMALYWRNSSDYNGQAAVKFTPPASGQTRYIAYKEEVNLPEITGWGVANPSQGPKATNATNLKPGLYWGTVANVGNPISGTLGMSMLQTSGSSANYRCQLVFQDSAGGAMYLRASNAGVFGNYKQVTTSAVSDERLKTVRGNLNLEGALDNINRMDFKIFSFLSDGPERSYRRGVISQQIRQIDKQYTKEIGGYYHLDQTPMLLDALAAIKALRARDEANKAEIAELKAAIAELKK